VECFALSRLTWARVAADIVFFPFEKAGCLQEGILPLVSTDFGRSDDGFIENRADISYLSTSTPVFYEV
jgi:hypothetical protein